MKIRTRESAIELRRGWRRIIALGFLSSLLALTLACSSAAQPQEPASPNNEAEQVQSSPAAAQPSAELESVSQTQSIPAQPSAESSARAETPVTAGAGPQPQQSTELAVAQEVLPDQPTGSPEATAVAVEPQPAAIAVVPEFREEPPAEPTEAMNPGQGSTVPREATATAAPWVEPAPNPTPAPAPTSTVAPTPTEASAPVAPEPLPEVGSKVGNRIPDVTLELFDGTTVSTAGLVAEGKPTFLFFFATT